MKNSKIKRREDSFFGIHSDFHARAEDNVVIGKTLDEKDIREVCELLKPDFVQIDCKGHPGWASYPTKLGNAMPDFDKDPLMLWRKVTKEYSIGLYVHFSGVYDIKYCLEHPEDAVINAEGNYEPSVLPFSKYYDEFFIPQISEIVENYGIDGVWIDGDCWSVKPDYRDETLEKFQEKTGIDLKGNAPKTPDDAYYFEYVEYAREGFRECLKYYVDILHSKYPKLQICSNWAFSDHMPEGICADVDFLSGDLNPLNCVNSARYAGRMLAQQGMAWDLMSWNFRFPANKLPLICQKHITQIMQEAASVIALGGAYQDYIYEFKDGCHNFVQLKNIKPLSDFMRAREPYCFKGKQIHQVAMLVSTYDRYRNMTMPFTREGMEKHMGLTALMCDSGVPLELVGEHTLKGRYSDYPVIVAPELYYGLEKDTVEELKAYAQSGGSLLIIGAKTSRFFADNGFEFKSDYYDRLPEVPNWANCDIGHNKESYASKMPCYFSVSEGRHGVIEGACTITPETEEYKVFGTLHNSLRGEGVPFAVEYPFGKGKIAVVGIDLGTQYNGGMQYLHRDLIKNLMPSLYTPVAKLESACGMVEIVPLKKDGRLMLQLVNSNGNHTNPTMVTEDIIPPALDIKLSVKTHSKPEALILQPENRHLDFEYRDGRVYFTVDRVDIHSIVEVKETKDV